VVSRTVGIIDFAHSGTTMLAGCLEILGVPMVGQLYKPMKWEDVEVIRALQDEGRFAVLAQQRNRQHAIWGFKYPGAWKFMDILTRHLQDPVWLAIFKEPVSVTQRRFNAVTMDKLLNTMRAMQAGVEGMRATGQPVHLLSYHRAVVDPLGFVLGLVGLVGLQPTPGQIDAAVGFIKPNEGGARRAYPLVAEWLR